MSSPQILQTHLIIIIIFIRMFNLCYYSRSKHPSSKEQGKKTEDPVDRTDQVEEWELTDTGVSLPKEQSAIQEQKVIEYYIIIIITMFLKSLK